MPATEETYRPQPILHLVFAISSIAMLLATVWMVMADHLRPWKEVQREFQAVERAKLEASKDEKLKEQKAKYEAQLADIDKKIEAAKAAAETRAARISELDKELEKLGGTVDLLDMQKRFKKADLDSKRSLYDGMVERGEEHEAKAYLASVVFNTEKELTEFSKQLETAQSALKKAKDEKEQQLGYVDKLEDDKKKMTREADNVARTIEQKDALYGGPEHWYSAPMAFLRSLPGIDLMPPTKIQQISLPELTINYNFKEVPRYDRCTTCHQGIDRLGYDKGPGGQPMKAVFAAHPSLTTGATTTDPKGKVVTAGLYLDGNGPHPINSFGCTICHGGQGSGTDFTFASHTPDTLKQGHIWHEEYGWHSFHMWDFPMHPRRFIESSCLKCHHEVTDIPQAKQLQAGFQRIVKYGCTGCHAIGGGGAIGPDLSEEPQVGPNLSHVGSKVSKEWILKWIIDPHGFRPDSRMPRFYGLTNNAAGEDWPKNYAESNAIAHYLFTKTTEPAGFVDPPAKTDPAKGKDLFFQKGCLACHQHRPYQEGDLQKIDKERANPAYFAEKDKVKTPKLDAAASYDPKNFPASVRNNAMANFGPNLSNIAAKFQSKAQGQKWLTNWIHAPETYHPRSLMPNLQLSLQEAADIASWIISVPGEWPVTVEVPGAEHQGGEGGRRRAGQALRLQERQLQASRWQVGGQVAERGRFVRPGAGDGGQALLPRREDDRQARLLRLPHHPRLRDRQAHRHRAQRLGDQEPRSARLRPYSRIPRRTGSGRQQSARWHPEYLSGGGHPRDADGLPLPEAAPPAKLRLPEEEREVQTVGRSAPNAPVRLGRRAGGGRGGYDVHPRADR